MSLFVLVRPYLARVRGMRIVVRTHVYLDRSRVILSRNVPHENICCSCLIESGLYSVAQGHYYAESRAACQHCTAGKGVQRAGHGRGKPPSKQCTHNNQILIPTMHTRTLVCTHTLTDEGAGTHTIAHTHKHTHTYSYAYTHAHTHKLPHIHLLHRRTLSRSRWPSTYMRIYSTKLYLYLLSISILCICMYVSYYQWHVRTC